MEWLKRLFRRPCDCDACTGRVRNVSKNPRVGRGLHIEIGRDGNVHYRAKSSIRES